MCYVTGYDETGYVTGRYESDGGGMQKDRLRGRGGEGRGEGGGGGVCNVT
jgi:hypothetical protein